MARRSNFAEVGDPINFEIELRTDGVIKTRYGAGGSNIDLLPTVGIGGGGQDGYVITSHSVERGATRGDQFEWRAKLLSRRVQRGLQVSAANLSVNENAGTVNFVVTRSRRFRRSDGELRDQRQLRRKL